MRVGGRRPDSKPATGPYPGQAVQASQVGGDGEGILALGQISPYLKQSGHKVWVKSESLGSLTEEVAP